MSIFYDNLPLPLFLGITFLVPILICMHFYKERSKYPFAALIGIVFLCLTAFSAGMVRIFEEFKLFQQYSHWFGAIPIPFILGAIPLILVGAYQKVKHDEVKRKTILFLAMIQLVIFLFIVFLSIFKPWE